MPISVTSRRRFSPTGRPSFPVLLVALTLAAGLLAPIGAVAQSEGALLPLSAAPRVGERIEAASGAAAEVFSFDDRLASSLVATPVERDLTLEALPVAPGERADVIVARHEIYAPDAKIFAIGKSGTTEVSRSRWIFFWGSSAEDPATRVFLSVDPDQGEIRGFATGPKGTWDFEPYAAAGEGQSLIAPPAFFQTGSKNSEPTWACGEDEGPGFLSFPPSVAAGAAGGGPDAITTLHSITLAIDTDNEFMLNKACSGSPPVCNNTAAASNYLASLVAAMSAIYERDLLVRLLQGNTTLRPSTTADPYAQNSNGNASSAELSEFSSYWNANFGGVTRGLSMMISGKQPQSNSASGIAWINGLCSTSVGYSFSKVFGPAFAVSNDAKLVGHELGHNFGSPH
ncbi:MAG TPA: M12 family metallo-peptidase, partial [Thermoanaerobaculia bacterium]|nr:M12 family metallo-peptidase [Thermoanaerobaculia bacterium]